MIAEKALHQLRKQFGSSLQENELMSRHTTVRIGGPADALLVASTMAELESTLKFCWELNVPPLLLGGGSNVLVSDKGIRGMVVINRTSEIRIAAQSEPPTAFAESGVMLSALARQAAEAGLTGLEWASPIPGTVGGAVYGNAGAHGGEICKCLILAEILHPVEGRLSWNCAEMGFAYRSSLLKRTTGSGVILSAQFKMQKSTSEEVLIKMKNIADRRRAFQPTGFSIGSIFRNPEGDKAGRLIESIGLKGRRIGNAFISPVHANFIINDGNSSASDYLALVKLAQSEVQRRFGVHLHPEIELVGDWDEMDRSIFAQPIGMTGQND